MSIIIFLSLIFSKCAYAGVELFIWDRGDGAPRLVVARTEMETPEQAVERYVQLIKRQTDFKKITPTNFDIDPGTAKQLKASAKTSTALIANTMEHLNSDDIRIHRVVDVFARGNADVYVLLPFGEIGLSDADAESYRSQVAEHFNLLVSLGGADIDPELYGQENTMAEDIVPSRDLSEFLLVKKFKERAKGIYFGICRGHQMNAITEGHKLYQDISLVEGGNVDVHRVSGQGNSGATATPATQTWHHILIEKDTLLARMLRKFIDPDTNQIWVNSLHHQLAYASGRARVSAWHGNSEVEAIESRNKKNISIQWHFELPETATGNKNFSDMGAEFIRQVVAYARLIRIQGSRSCTQLFSL